MKKINNKIFANITKIYKGDLCVYRVTFTREYDKVSFFGLINKHIKKDEEVPFFFKSFEIAKDFCSIFPYYCTHDVVNDNYEDHCVFYDTYIIKCNGKIAYVKWDRSFTSTLDRDGDIIFAADEEIPLVDKFVSKIILKDWMKTNSLNDVSYRNEADKLSEVCYSDKEEESWKFELVENK